MDFYVDLPKAGLFQANTLLSRQSSRIHRSQIITIFYTKFYR